MRTLSRRIIALVLVATLGLVSSPVQSQNTIEVLLGGRPLTFDVPPALADGRVIVPVRTIFEALGASVSWNATNRRVVAVRGESRIELTVGSQAAWVNDEFVYLSAAPQMAGGRVLVPLRFVSESLGARVDWNPDTRTVTITQPEDVLLTEEDQEHPADPAPETEPQPGTAVEASPNPSKRPKTSPVDTLPQEGLTPAAHLDTGGAPTGWFRVSGVVQNAQSAAVVPGAKISARATGQVPYTGEATAGDDGSYQLDLLQSFSYTLTVSAPCYQSGTEPVSQAGRLNLPLSPVSPSAATPLNTGSYRIFGVVRDQSGEPVAGACVTTVPPSRAEYLTDSSGMYLLDRPQWQSVSLSTRREGCETADGAVNIEGPPSEGGPRNAPAISAKIRTYYFIGRPPADPLIRADIPLTCGALPRDVASLPVSATIAAGESATAVCQGTIGTDPGYVRLTRQQSAVVTRDSAQLTAHPVGDQPNVELRWWLTDRYGGTLHVDGCTATYVAPATIGSASQISIYVHVAREGWSKPGYISDPAFAGKGAQRILVYAGNQPAACNAPLTVRVHSSHGIITGLAIQGIGAVAVTPGATVTVPDVPKGIYTLTVTTTLSGILTGKAGVGCPGGGEMYFKG